METENISQYSLRAPEGQVQQPANNSAPGRGPMRSLPQVKDKIMKYDSFLLKNRNELNSKEF